ncbi:Delta-1-pyrroline-5-carboxylate dehydrogenase 12A1- mitochondrial [Striga hermonthica]|uniref:Delta-1-pyrroline-5-carboxylate dehydrogenase 12A1- mitochondrial n=1 Tax=Striga hermonthica TaxID=68872 RepID=A0A9N7P2K2_STRHE|nr:Delta-1-pyrroline-5-carboxylate dehydrogenase 12A1- mitochondrial [Striga hermonthica]
MCFFSEDEDEFLFPRHKLLRRCSSFMKKDPIGKKVSGGRVQIKSTEGSPKPAPVESPPGLQDLFLVDRCELSLDDWCTHLFSTQRILSPSSERATGRWPVVPPLEGNWTKSLRWNNIPDPLNGELFIEVSEVDENEIKPFVESLSSCPKHGLHNPFKASERYVMLGDVTTKAAHKLSLPEISEFFAKLKQRVSTKSYQQAFAEVYVTQKFLENFCGDQVRFLARSFVVPDNHLGQQSYGFRWSYGPIDMLNDDKYDRVKGLLVKEMAFSKAFDFALSMQIVITRSPPHPRHRRCFFNQRGKNVPRGFPVVPGSWRSQDKSPDQTARRRFIGVPGSFCLPEAHLVLTLSWCDSKLQSCGEASLPD